MNNRWVWAAMTLAFYAALLALMLALAGTAHLPSFWVVFGTQTFLGVLAVAIIEPDVLSERMRPGGKDEDARGKILITILWLGQLSIAALDVGRLHVGDAMPGVVMAAAYLVHLVGWAGFIWAVRVNRYFSSAIRLQQDRGQTVITSGPYAFVRHPGYIFGSLMLVGQGLALGSWLTLIPSAFLVSHMMYRTRLEERLLADNLAGYRAYIQSVPYRWIPGVW